MTEVTVSHILFLGLISLRQRYKVNVYSKVVPSWVVLRQSEESDHIFQTKNNQGNRVTIIIHIMWIVLSHKKK